MATNLGSPPNLEADGRDVRATQDSRGRMNPHYQPMMQAPMTTDAQMAGQTGAAPVTQTTQIISPQDRVRWGPVWAGLITTLSVFLVLELLFYSVGALSNVSASGVITPANQWVTAVMGVIAFFIGGWVAEATSAARGVGAGVINGLMVWGLATTLLLVLSALGVTSLFSFAGAGASAGLGAVVNPRAVTLGVFISLVVAAVAAALGGFAASFGGPIGRLTRR